MFFCKKEVNRESIFKDVSELKVNQPRYPIKTPEEIKAQIEAADNLAHRQVFFRDSYLLKSTKKELRRKGYRVKVFNYDGGPSFEISW